MSLKIWILVTEMCLKVENAFKFDNLEASKDKKVTIGSLAQP